VEFKSFLGRDAVKYLKLYLQTRQNLTDDSPLFTKLGSEERVTVGAVQKRFREIAGETDFIGRKELENGYNPARPHSLRAAFRSQLTGKMDGDLIEFFMGHTIGEQKRAYLNLPTDELRELYANYEKYLSIEKTSRDELSGVTEAGRVTEELKTRVGRLEGAVTRLAEENEELRTGNKELAKRFNRLDSFIREWLKDRMSEDELQRMEVEEDTLEEVKE